MTTVPEWIGYRAEVAVKYGTGAVEIGHVRTFSNERVVVETDSDTLRFHMATLSMVGAAEVKLTSITPDLRRRAVRRATIRRAVRSIRSSLRDDHFYRLNDDVSGALAALIELRDEVARRIAALSELDD
jgi:hypothetical protein